MHKKHNEHHQHDLHLQQDEWTPITQWNLQQHDMHQKHNKHHQHHEQQQKFWLLIFTLNLNPTSTLRPKILTNLRFPTCRPLRIKPMGYSYNLIKYQSFNFKKPHFLMNQIFQIWYPNTLGDTKLVLWLITSWKTKSIMNQGFVLPDTIKTMWLPKQMSQCRWECDSNFARE